MMTFREPKDAPAYGSSASSSAHPTYNPPAVSMAPPVQPAPPLSASDYHHPERARAAAAAANPPQPPAQSTLTTVTEPKEPPAYGSSASTSAVPPYNPPSVARAAQPNPIAKAGAPFRGVGILSKFCQHRTPLALRVIEGGRGSATADDFDITDAVTGQKVFRLDAAFWSRNKKRMYDSLGKEILVLRPDIGWVKSWRIENSELKRDMAWIDAKFSFGTKLKTKFANRAGDGKMLELRIEGKTGSFRDPIVDIMLQDGTILARIERQKTDRLSSWMRIDNYILTVQPGVDAAFMVALCVCADELYEK